MFSLEGDGIEEKASITLFTIKGNFFSRVASTSSFVPLTSTSLSSILTLTEKEVFDKVGLLPENFGKGFFEDVLLCYRAKRAGFKLGITEGTEVKHLYHTTFKAEGYDITKEYLEKRKLFLDIIKKER